MNRLPLVVVVLALSSAFAQTPPDKRVDHFRCYAVAQSPPAKVEIQLEDQFDAALKKPENINQLMVVHFCNPVEKIHNNVTVPIVNPNHHLTIFEINPQPPVTRVVVVKNQFGEQTLKVGPARFLAVPTGKALAPKQAPEPSADLDHYKCYPATGKALENVTIGLKDQFLGEKVEVLKPVSFCNPVQKNHAGVTFKPRNPDVHLTCYETSASKFQGAKINTRSQFGAREFGVLQPDRVCVPSLKLKWSLEGVPGTRAQ